jgi:hypothetical protein
MSVATLTPTASASAMSRSMLTADLEMHAGRHAGLPLNRRERGDLCRGEARCSCSGGHAPAAQLMDTGVIQPCWLAKRSNWV